MKLGMVFEGGANRTVFSCGVMDAFLEEGLMPDYLIGVSAGIAYGVSYLSGQKGRNIEVVENYIADKRYMGMRHLFNRNEKAYFNTKFVFEEVPNELYKEFMTDIANEIERENKIINDLLSLVKMDKTEADLHVSQVDINEQMELILKRLRPIARKQNVEVVFESIRPVVAEVDEVKLTLAFSNLVENTIKYNKTGGFVKVTLDADHQFFTLEVSDSGIGIPEEAQEHIFERFYRVDKSHSREIGGTGLGLAITRSAVLMHRASIKVSSVLEEGTTFVVKIPLIHQVS